MVQKINVEIEILDNGFIVEDSYDGSRIYFKKWEDAFEDAKKRFEEYIKGTSC